MQKPTRKWWSGSSIFSTVSRPAIARFRTSTVWPPPVLTIACARVELTGNAGSSGCCSPILRSTRSYGCQTSSEVRTSRCWPGRRRSLRWRPQVASMPVPGGPGPDWHAVTEERDRRRREEKRAPLSVLRGTRARGGEAPGGRASRGPRGAQAAAWMVVSSPIDS